MGLVGGDRSARARPGRGGVGAGGTWPIEFVDRRHPEISKSAGDPVAIATPPPDPTRPRARGCPDPTLWRRGSSFPVHGHSILTSLPRYESGRGTLVGPPTGGGAATPSDAPFATPAGG